MAEFEGGGISEKRQKVEKKEEIQCWCYFEDEDVRSLEGCEMCNRTSNHDSDSDSDDEFICDYPAGTPKELRPDSDQISDRYDYQTRLTYGFEFYDFPGHIVPIVPLLNFKKLPDFGLMMKLATRAIKEYNEKEHNVFKYKLLKIEKVNYMISGHEQYFMTVKVSNLTLVTPIETFHIHVAKKIGTGFEEVLSCGPKGVEPDFSIFRKLKIDAKEYPKWKGKGTGPI